MQSAHRAGGVTASGINPQPAQMDPRSQPRRWLVDHPSVCIQPRLAGIDGLAYTDGPSWKEVALRASPASRSEAVTMATEHILEWAPSRQRLHRHRILKVRMILARTIHALLPLLAACGGSEPSTSTGQSQLAQGERAAPTGNAGVWMGQGADGKVTGVYRLAPHGLATCGAGALHLEHNWDSAAALQVSWNLAAAEMGAPPAVEVTCFANQRHADGHVSASALLRFGHDRAMVIEHDIPACAIGATRLVVYLRATVIDGAANIRELVNRGSVSLHGGQGDREEHRLLRHPGCAQIPTLPEDDGIKGFAMQANQYTRNILPDLLPVEVVSVAPKSVARSECTLEMALGMMARSQDALKRMLGRKPDGDLSALSHWVLIRKSLHGYRPILEGVALVEIIEATLEQSVLHGEGASRDDVRRAAEAVFGHRTAVGWGGQAERGSGSTLAYDWTILWDVDNGVLVSFVYNLQIGDRDTTGAAPALLKVEKAPLQEMSTTRQELTLIVGSAYMGVLGSHIYIVEGTWQQLCPRDGLYWSDSPDAEAVGRQLAQEMMGKDKPDSGIAIAKRYTAHELEARLGEELYVAQKLIEPNSSLSGRRYLFRKNGLLYGEWNATAAHPVDRMLLEVARRQGDRLEAMVDKHKELNRRQASVPPAPLPLWTTRAIALSEDYVMELIARRDLKFRLLKNPEASYSGRSARDDSQHVTIYWETDKVDGSSLRIETRASMSASGKVSCYGGHDFVKCYTRYSDIKPEPQLVRWEDLVAYLRYWK